MTKTFINTEIKSVQITSRSTHGSGKIILEFIEKTERNIKFKSRKFPLNKLNSLINTNKLSGQIPNELNHNVVYIFGS